jgi:MFS family permease
MTEATMVRLGVRANWLPFGLLLLAVLFVGAVVGVERSVLPLLAKREFGISSAAVTLNFLIAFGIAKAASNYLAGELTARLGTRRVLLAGWLFGVPVPFIIISAPSWHWITLANFFLGVNQGLAWSATQFMKIDLAGARRRGVATGLNEFGGYLGVALAALGAGYLADAYGPRPAPFRIAAGAALCGLLVTLVGIRDTVAHVELEHAALLRAGASGPPPPRARALARFAANQAGLINNLKEGVAWGLFPLYLAAAGLNTRQIGWLAALYPAVWGAAQAATGALSDALGRRPLIVGGLLLQAAALLGFAAFHRFETWAAAAIALGLGTAAVYPTLIAQVGDLAEPRGRPRAVGRYRLWRDLGYAAGGLLAGILADLFGFRPTIAMLALVVAASAAGAQVLLPAPSRRGQS